MSRISRALSLVQSAEELSTRQADWGTVGLRSRYSSDHLARIAAVDMFGDHAVAGPLTRDECMGIPAIARARHKLVVAVARGVLTQLNGEGPLAQQPRWLSSTGGATSPAHRLVWTVDDLIFGGWSLWAVAREGSDPTDPITDAGRAPRGSWQLDGDGVVQIKDAAGDWVDVEDDSTVVLIPGFHEGLLAYGTRSIRAAIGLEETAAARSRNPIPAVELHHTGDGDPLTDAEIDDLVDAATEAIQSTGGAVIYTPKNIDLRTHGTSEPTLLIQGRNAAAIDAARLVGLPASTIDASNVNASLTYETTEGRNFEFTEDSIALYADPIAARLSLDDVCPPGERIAFDFSASTALNPPPTGPNRQD